jgi:hypothetical protein
MLFIQVEFNLGRNLFDSAGGARQLRMLMKLKPFLTIFFFAFMAVAGVADRSNGDAGNGFFYNGIKFKEYRDDGLEMSGEIINRSGQNFKFVVFDLALYDNEGDIIDTKMCPMMPFMDGESRRFEELLKGRLRKLSGFSIRYVYSANLPNTQ